MPWAPGQSGNPGGRPPETIDVKEVRRLAQAKSQRAYEIIAGLMEDADKDSVRLAAALSILRLAGMRFDADVGRDVTPVLPTPDAAPTTPRLLAIARGTG